MKPLVGCTYEDIPDATPSPEPRRSHVACTRGDEMFVYGGQSERGTFFTEDVWVFNMKTSTWKQHKTKHHIPQCVKRSSAWLNGNQMFLFGGENALGKYSNDLCSLDLDTWEWTLHTTSGKKPSGRQHHVLWTIANNIIVFGGRGNEGYTNDTYHLNTHTMKWTELSTTGTPPSARAGCAHAQCAGKGFLFGGVDGHQRNNDLHMFDLTSHVWTKLQPISGSFPPARTHSRMIVRGTDLIIYGGYGGVNTTIYGGKVLSDCWVWNIEKKTWRELKDHNSDGRYKHTACYMSDDDSVLIFGGTNMNRKIVDLGRISFV